MFAIGSGHQICGNYSHVYYIVQISANMETGFIGNPPASLLLALQKLLRPLVRLLLAQGVTYPMLASQLKAVCMQVAKEESS